MRILTSDDIHQALPMTEAIDAMRQAFIELARGQVQSPQRLVITTAKGSNLFMPAYMAESGALVQKIVSVYPGNHELGLPTIHGIVIMLDTETGRPLALMDGAALTAIRTGAASGLATDLLARPDAHVFALIGAGGQAYEQVRAVMAVREITEVRISSRRGASAERLARKLRAEGIPARATDPREAVRGADIITTVTDSRTPVFLDADVSRGTHINLVGAYTRDMQEAPASTILRARVFVDDVMAAAHEAGDIIKPVRAGLFSMDELTGTLGDLLLGRVQGRRRPQDITVFKSVGLAVQDAAAAARALVRAEALGLGVQVEL